MCAAITVGRKIGALHSTFPTRHARDASCRKRRRGKRNPGPPYQFFLHAHNVSQQQLVPLFLAGLSCRLFVHMPNAANADNRQGVCSIIPVVN